MLRIEKLDVRMALHVTIYMKLSEDFGIQI